MGSISESGSIGGSSIFQKFYLQSVARGLIPDHRVSKCYRVRIKKFVSVNFIRHEKKAYYTGLAVCGSIWACPVCASKISERRKIELQSINFEGYYLYFVTCTLSHGAEDKLSVLVTALTAALRSVRSGRWWVEFKEKYSIVGSITAQEVTFSLKNGFHPHKHILFISSSPIDNLENFKAELFARYNGKLLKRGRHANYTHGVDVRACDGGALEYISKVTKWGIESELTKGTVKKSIKAADTFSMFGLLGSSSAYLQSKFVEYVRAYTGARQMVYSAGLRDLFHLGEDISEEDLALQEVKEDHYLLAELSALDWKNILYKKLRAECLEVASQGSSELLHDWVSAVVYG